MHWVIAEGEPGLTNEESGPPTRSNAPAALSTSTRSKRAGGLTGDSLLQGHPAGKGENNDRRHLRTQEYRTERRRRRGEVGYTADRAREGLRAPKGLGRRRRVR